MRTIAAFAFFRGACTRGIYDNMKTAVETNLMLVKRAAPIIAASCKCAVITWWIRWPARRRLGWEKGQVENQVGLVRERVLHAAACGSKAYDELNAWLTDRCVGYAKAHPHPERSDQTVWEVFEAERSSLVAYCGRFDGFHALPASVSKTCLVPAVLNAIELLSRQRR